MALYKAILALYKVSYDTWEGYEDRTEGRNGPHPPLTRWVEHSWMLTKLIGWLDAVTPAERSLYRDKFICYCFIYIYQHIYNVILVLSLLSSYLAILGLTLLSKHLQL